MTNKMKSILEFDAVGVSVFVYGSLMQGEHNHERYLGHARYLGRAITAVPALLFSCEGYPAMVVRRGAVREKHGPLPVHGEVYDVTTLELLALDRLEGVAVGHYRRVEIPVYLADDDEPMLVETYVQDFASQAGRKRVISGSWRLRRET